MNDLLRTAVRVLAAALAGALALPAVGGAASTADVDVLKAFRAQLPKAKRTGVPVLLPRLLVLGGPPPRLYAEGAAHRRGWVLSLGAAPRCGTANACFVASFEAIRGARLPVRPNVRLTRGIRGHFVPIRCGASCGPASIMFVRGGVLYSWRVKDPRLPARGALVAMPNAAIRAGPR